jgi:hypothetical protein
MDFIFIAIATLIVAAIGVPYVIYHKKYKQILSQLESKEGDE